MSKRAYEIPLLFEHGTPAYDVHAAVYSLMQSPASDEPRDFIFDISHFENETGFIAVVRSTRIPDKAPGTEVNSPISGEYKFTLRALARKSSRTPISNDTDRLEWLRRKGEKHGFRTIGIVDVRSRPRSFQKASKKEFTIYESIFEGILQVFDEDLFSEAWLQGIGAGRSFGYGLIACTSLSDSRKQ